MKSIRMRRDRSGATAVIFAGAFIPLLAVAGLVIDVGNIFSAKRRLQGTTDLAAIAAATNLTNATQAAGANAVINGYQASEVALVELGVYTPDPAVPASLRFRPGNQPPNAARVTMTHQQPLFFGPVFRMAGGNRYPEQDLEAITTQAIAASQKVADFTIGSRVASFNGGLVNGVLGALLGTNIQLSAVDYNALATTNVDLFGMAHALSLQAGQVSGTYKQAVSGTVTLPQFLAALGSVSPAASAALAALGPAANLGNGLVDLSKLIEFGPYSNLSISDPEPNITATASLLNLLQAAAEVGGPAHLIDLSFNAGLPGIASVTGAVSLGEPAVGSTVIAVDEVGSSVHTAQLRVYLNMSLVGTGSLALVQLPVYLEVGYGTASLSSVSCQALVPSSTSVTLAVTPGLVNAWIGSVTAAQMTNYSTEPVVSPATFVNLGLVTVSGRANVQIGNQSPTMVAFSSDDISNNVVKNTATSDFATALYASLLQRTVITVNGLGLPGLQGAVAGVLAGAAAPVDQVLDGVLKTLGLGVGEADTWVNGARCRAALLAG